MERRTSIRCSIDDAPVAGIVMMRPMTALPAALSVIEPSAFDVPHAFDEVPVDIHHLQHAVRPSGSWARKWSMSITPIGTIRGLLVDRTERAVHNCPDTPTP